jgi:tetratricopeptide (TPR) repeat protein
MTQNCTNTAEKIPAKLPACARVGHLDEARELVDRKQWPNAWTAAFYAISARPYHPEAYLLLAEIAREAGDASAARRCAKAARDMAPGWAPPKQFLKGDLRGNSKPGWMQLPPPLCAAQTPAPRVSVCLIVKNEERLLPQCLRSVRELASQIIVIDTGSTDRTVEIAREMGAEVHAFAWCDDFSAARNAALEHATGDWILSIDADEELMPGQAAIIAREIKAAGIMGYRLRLFDSGKEHCGCSYVPRLFRNAPEIYFAGRIHEQAFGSVDVRCKQWGLSHELSQAGLLHHGYTGEVVASRNKSERNLRLLEQSLQESPGDPNLIMNLGLELVRAGKLEAGLERYWEAFRLVSVQPVAEVSPEWREELLTQLASNLMGARRFSDIVQLWRNPFANHGGLTAAQHFSQGVALMELKQPAEAAEQIRQCIAKRARKSFSPVPLEVLKAAPHHCLALCLIALNDTAGAQQAFDAALAAEPSSRPARFDLARFHAAQGRTAEALKILRQMAAENPAEARVWELGGQIALSHPEYLAFARDWTSQAVNTFPNNAGLLGQRAEALLLSQDVAQALPLWRRAQASRSPRQMAAVVICELLTDDRQYHFSSDEEPAISQEVLQWYLQCIRMGAHTLVHQLHGRLESIRLVLPAFVHVVEAARRQTRQAAQPAVLTS